MLEKMGDFFDARLDGYEEHQLTAIDGADGFYSYTASLLPRKAEAEILDLGAAELDLSLTDISRSARPRASPASTSLRGCCPHSGKSIRAAR